MKHVFPIGIVLALVTAGVLTWVWPLNNALDVSIDNSVRAQAAVRRDPYKLTELKVFRAVMPVVTDRYVDPGRIDPHRMLLAGLFAVQKTVPSLLVDLKEDTGTFDVRVGEHKRTFVFSSSGGSVGRGIKVRSTAMMAERFREVFAFIEDKLTDEDIKLQDIEYTAMKGVLSTLDPHTALLTPDEYEDMRTHTQGQFGGVGMLIGIRDGKLTVIKPFPGTPAERVGIKKGDHIVRINDESTMNMPSDEAANRMRGEPDSHVDIWIVRKGPGGFAAPRKFRVTRAVIHIDSVKSKMLSDHVGYLKVESFQGNTYADMERALNTMTQEGMKALVLDLRDNGGGLLDQAVRMVDYFVKKGTIVRTVSRSPEQRDVRSATDDKAEPAYPMAILVNAGSASASEIVAGALKNLNRAIIIGERTFGKGSVQVLDENQDGSAIKITTAQYLTPGDISIQGVGITPDIEIDPITVDTNIMNMIPNHDAFHESDFASHLTHQGTKTEQPLYTTQYYLTKETRLALIEADQDEDNTNENEFLLDFSKRLFAALATATDAPAPSSVAPWITRAQLLEHAEAVVTESTEREKRKAITELQTLGVDWSVGPVAAVQSASADAGALLPLQTAFEVQVTASKDRPMAGDPYDITLSVTNKSNHPVHQLHAISKSDFQLFNDREFVFGALLPGETKTWTSTMGVCMKHDGPEGPRSCKLPKHLSDIAPGIRFEFFEANSHVPEPVFYQATVLALPKPELTFQIQTQDTGGNRDGILQVGELITVRLNIKNLGHGKTHELQALLQNMSGPGIELRDGRFELGSIAPGQEKMVPFTFKIEDGFEASEVKFDLQLYDEALRETIKDRVVFEVNRTPSAESRAMQSLMRRPPHIEVNPVELSTRASSIHITGKAMDETQVKDIAIYVGSLKAYYTSGSSGTTTRELAYDATLQLRPGLNVITIFARENNKSIQQHSFVVRRDGVNGEMLSTPKTDPFGFEVEL